MLQKIISIKNVGRFRNCKAAGDVRFGKATLIYAPNGGGKTTLCDILRSLKSGDGKLILGRHTIGVSDLPAVDVLLDSGKASFKSGAWSATLPELEIYDSRFIYENVYAGESVEHEQRKNLHRVILGEEDVKLSKKVQDLGQKSREAGRILKEKEAEVRALIPGGAVDVKTFLSLAEDAEAEGKIESAKREVAALAAASELKAKPLLSPVTIPSFPEGLEELLGTTLAGVSESAEQTIREHMESHMTRPDEQWLVTGLGLVKGDACPFCAGSLWGNELLVAYKAHFAGKYEELREMIASWKEQVRDLVDDQLPLTLQQSITTNAKRVRAWDAYVTVRNEPELDVEVVVKALQTYREEALALLDAKQKSPLEKLEGGELFTAAAEGVVEAKKLVETYNLATELLNGSLRAKQAVAKPGDLVAAAKRELGKLEATKARYTDTAVAACTAWEKSRLARRALETQVQASRDELNLHSQKLFQRYETSINRYLKHFGASFRIGSVCERYLGGDPSTTYSIVIGDTEVALGNAKTPPEQRSFKNTLSSGDKSALALAFFLAKVSVQGSSLQAPLGLMAASAERWRSRRDMVRSSAKRIGAPVGIR